MRSLAFSNAKLFLPYIMRFVSLILFTLLLDLPILIYLPLQVYHPPIIAWVGDKVGDKFIFSHSSLFMYPHPSL